jgi:hypothetical protein
MTDQDTHARTAVQSSPQALSTPEVPGADPPEDEPTPIEIPPGGPGEAEGEEEGEEEASADEVSPGWASPRPPR